MQDNGLASSDDMHSMEVDWYDKKLYFGDFKFFENAKNLSLKSSPVNDCTPNYAWVLSGNTGMITHRHDLFISLVFLKSRTYLPCPSLGHIRTRCAFVDNFEFAKNNAFESASMSASECPCCSDWAVSWNLVGSISCALVWAWDNCWGCSCSAIVDIRGSQQCTVCRQCTACVLCAWCGCCLSQFKFVFVFPDSCVCCRSASYVCVSQRQQWPSHWAVQRSKLSVAKKREQLRVHILNSHENT